MTIGRFCRTLCYMSFDPEILARLESRVALLEREVVKLWTSQESLLDLIAAQGEVDAKITGVLERLTNTGPHSRAAG